MLSDILKSSRPTLMECLGKAMKFDTVRASMEELRVMLNSEVDSWSKGIRWVRTILPQ